MRATDPLSNPAPPLADGADRTHYEAELASAFAHPLRLSLLRRLAQEPACVNALVEAAQVSQPMVSRHLATLRRLAVVTCRVEGRNRCYALRDPAFVMRVLNALSQCGR